MDLFRFGNNGLLILMYTLPVLLGLFIASVYLRKRTLKKFGEAHLLLRLMPDYSLFRHIMKFTILLIALLFLIIAIAQPQFGAKLEEVKKQGIELVIALDVSNSMLAEDISPNRLERAKMEIGKQIDRLDGDKVGIIVFAGDAYTQLPMTTDYGAVKLFLKTINTGFVPKQGTAIGSAIDLAINSFTPETEAGRAIIIISDGEEHEDNPLESAQKAAEEGIVIHTLGMATIKGAPIPEYDRYRGKTFKKDREGGIILTKLNDKVLNEIAITGGGIFQLASNSSVGLKEIVDNIEKMNKVEYETQKFTEYDEKFQYFLAITIFLLLLDSVILSRKNKLFRNIKIF